MLAEHYGVGAELWSATRYQQLRDEALEVERWNRLHPDEPPRSRWSRRSCSRRPDPSWRSATSCVRCPTRSRAGSLALDRSGTDGFGRSDTREGLRRYFETDAAHVVLTVLSELCAEGVVSANVVADALTPVRPRPRGPGALDGLTGISSGRPVGGRRTS